LPVEKRYQVFVSSTYKDLEEERREIIQALLELDCIPSGMELFPAANDDQWSLIKGVIDDCDYYIVIIAGRYGSVAADGLSFTEMEYRYALSVGKPIIAFLHKHPENISAAKTESDPPRKLKLDEFRDLAQKKMVKFWETPSELGSVVSRSLIRLIKDNPAEGWVRGGAISSDDAREEILRLNIKIKDLEEEVASTFVIDKAMAADLARGADNTKVRFIVSVRLDGSSYRTKKYYYDLTFTWDEIFSKIAPALINEATERQIEGRIAEYARIKYSDQLNSRFSKDDETFSDIGVEDDSRDAVIVQFIAIGWMQKGVRKRTAGDSGRYFALTGQGEKAMYELRAIRKSSAAAVASLQQAERLALEQDDVEVNTSEKEDD